MAKGSTPGKILVKHDEHFIKIEKRGFDSDGYSLKSIDNKTNSWIERKDDAFDLEDPQTVIDYLKDCYAAQKKTVLQVVQHSADVYKIIVPVGKAPKEDDSEE